MPALAAPVALEIEAEYRGPAVALTSLREGQSGTIRAIDLPAEDAELLRAMGLRPEARVRLCRVGRPCIIEVLGGATAGATGDCPRGADCSCRIGLDRSLASRVMVGVG